MILKKTNIQLLKINEHTQESIIIFCLLVAWKIYSLFIILLIFMNFLNYKKDGIELFSKIIL